MIGIYGGSFDPVHLGHLRAALEVEQQTGCHRIRFVPSRQPPHRSGPVAPAPDRVAMLRLALAGHPEWCVDMRELQQEGPSYTIRTLESLRQETTESLLLLMGMDAFLHFETWHRYHDILSLAHVVVMARPGSQFSAGPGLDDRVVDEVSALQASPAGSIYVCEVTALDISSSRIRRDLHQGLDCRYLLPERVLDYIKTQELYT